MAMEMVNVGKIVNTFGINGELKIASVFECPEKVFVKGTDIYINNKIHQITSVRYHKNHYLIIIDNLDNINLVLEYKGYQVEVLRSLLSLESNEYLMNDLLDMEVYLDNKIVGKITEVINDSLNPLIKINNKFYIPLKANYIVNVEVKNNRINVQNIQELII